MSRTIYDILALRDGGYVCRYCKRPLNPHGIDRDTTLDHFQPLARGGKDHYSNLVLSCRSCNLAKGDMTPEQWSAARGLKLRRIRPENDSHVWQALNDLKRRDRERDKGDVI